MKKLFLSLLLLLGICIANVGFAITVTISGTVTDINNGAPIVNKAVHISSDSSNGFWYYNTVYTNSTGYYTTSIPNVNPVDSVMFLVKTADCNNIWQQQTVSGNSTPITVNFQICTGSGGGLTVTISGTVYEAGTVIPVPNHAVTISSDSTSGLFYYNTLYTNSNGFYTVTIGNVPSNTNFTVATYDCNNNYHSQTVSGNSSPITVNFYICVTPPPPTGNMWGHVFTGNIYADFGRVDLILSTNDTLMVVDSYFINDSAGMYNFSNVAAGNYLLMAELLETSASYYQYAPTYYTASLYWTGATLIQQGAATNQYDIHLVGVPGYAPGNGNITGNIQQTMKSSNGTPVPNMEVLLLDQSNQPLAYTRTDAIGNFSFANIAFGTYTIAPEKLSINTTPASVTLTAGNPNANLSFLLDNGNIFLGIGKKQPTFVNGEIKVYPNPVKENGVISINAITDSKLTFKVYDITGKLMNEMSQSVHKGENKITFSASSLISGYYFLQVTHEDGSSVTGKFIVNK